MQSIVLQLFFARLWNSSSIDYSGKSVLYSLWCTWYSFMLRISSSSWEEHQFSTHTVSQDEISTEDAGKNLQIICTCTKYYNIPFLYSQLFCAVLTTYSRRTHDVLTTYSRRTHDVLTTYSRRTHDVLTTYSRRTHDVLTTYSRRTHGVLTTYSPITIRDRPK